MYNKLNLYLNLLFAVYALFIQPFTTTELAVKMDKSVANCQEQQ
jgi:hypothetical protein